MKKRIVAILQSGVPAMAVFSISTTYADTNSCIQSGLQTCNTLRQQYLDNHPNNTDFPACGIIVLKAQNPNDDRYTVCPPAPGADIYGGYGCMEFISNTCIVDPPVVGGGPSVFKTPFEKPTQSCGSVIHNENQSVGEFIPVTGTTFELVYFSDRVVGRAADFLVKVPITGDNPSPDISTITMTVGAVATGLQAPPVAVGLAAVGGDTPAPPHFVLFEGLAVPAGAAIESQSFLGIVSNQTYDYIYSPPADLIGTAQIRITLSNTYSDARTDYPRTTTVSIGNYRPIAWGIGGWSLSIHHFYDFNTNRLHLGNGEAVSTTVSPYSLPGSTDPFYAAGSDDGSNQLYIFDSKGRHIKTVNSLTGAVLYSFSYDNSSRLIAVTDAYGNATTLVRSGDGTLTGIRSPYGQLTSVTLDSNGYLATVSNPLAENYSMTYSSGGLLHTFTKPTGVKSTFIYNNLGLLQSDTSSAGSSIALDILSSDINRTSYKTTTALGRTINYTASSQSYPPVQTVSFPEGSQLSRSIANRVNGLSKSSTERFQDNYGNIVDSSLNWSYDTRFGTSLFNPSSHNSTIFGSSGFMSASETYSQSIQEYSPGNDLQHPNYYSYSSIDTKATINGKVWNSNFTLSSLNTVFTSPVGRISSQTMDQFGKPVATQYASYAPISYSYDANGRISQVSQGSRNALVTYNSQGYVDHVTNALSQSVAFTYDGAGRVLTQTLPDTRVISYSYDFNGNLKSVTTPSGPQHSMGWNDFDFMSGYTPPVVGSTATPTTYSYNNDKQLTQVARPDGTTIVLNYNSSTGFLETVVHPSGQNSYSYTGPLLTAATSSDSIKVEREYLGNLPAKDTWSDSAGNIGRAMWTWNNDFNLTNSTVYSKNNATSSSVDFSYDNDGLLTQAGDENLYRNTSSGLLSLSNFLMTSDSYSYDPTYGELSSYSAAFNADAKKKKSKAFISLITQSFTRDGLGRITGNTEKVENEAANSYAYTYDSAGRLTDVTQNGSVVSQYVYDSNSNRTSGTVRGVPFTATYDSQDRLLTYGDASFAYNANGERTSKQIASAIRKHSKSIPIPTTYAYDALGNLKTVVTPEQVTISYKMDGLNRRQAKLVDGAIVAQYLYEDQYRIGAVLDNSGAIAYRFVYGSKPDVPDYMILASGAKFKIISDPNGSVRLVVNGITGEIAQRIDYDEFGVVINDTNPGFQPFGFAGGLYDSETGLTHFGARDYDASVGRWIQKDPIGFKGGDMNFYGYVMNDPINFIDPSGKSYTVPTQGGTFVYPGSPNSNLAGPPQLVPTQAMTTVDPGLAPVIPITPGTTVGYIGINRFIPGVGTGLAVLEAFLGPSPEQLPASVNNLANQMGHSIFPNDPTFQTASCPTGK